MKQVKTYVNTVSSLHSSFPVGPVDPAPMFSGEAFLFFRGRDIGEWRMWWAGWDSVKIRCWNSHKMEDLSELDII